MRVDIFSDLVCPWCFIGKKYFETAIALYHRHHSEKNFEVFWHPFELNPKLPLEGISRSDYLRWKFNSLSNASRIYEQIRISGLNAGIKFNFSQIIRQPNSSLAHKLVDFAQKKRIKEDILEAVFEAFFINGDDIGNMNTLVRIASRCGVMEDEARLQLVENRGNLEENEQLHQRLGITGVPFFLINKKSSLSGAQPPEIMLKALLSEDNQVSEKNLQKRPQQYQYLF